MFAMRVVDSRPAEDVSEVVGTSETEGNSTKTTKSEKTLQSFQGQRLVNFGSCRAVRIERN